MGLLYQFFPDARDNTWTPQEGNYRSVLRILIQCRTNLMTEASNARGKQDVAHAALRLSSGQNATSKTSGVAQLQAELSAVADFKCSRMTT